VAVFFLLFHNDERKQNQMAPALVGDPGEVSLGTVDCAPGYAQATTEGNFAYCWVWSNSSSESNPIDFSESNPSSGWNFLQRTGVPYNWVATLFKQELDSSEDAPQFAHDGNGTRMAGSLAEFSDVGGADFVGHSSEAAEVDAPSVDTEAGDLLLGVFTWNGNNGNPTVALQLYGSDGDEVTENDLSKGEGSDAPFWVFGYGIGPGTLGSEPNKSTCTSSAFNNAPAGVLASFRPAS
jgi:hypothetical protein